MTTAQDNKNFYRLLVLIASLVIIIAGLALTASLVGWCFRGITRFCNQMKNQESLLIQEIPNIQREDSI